MLSSQPWILSQGLSKFELLNVNSSTDKIHEESVDDNQCNVQDDEEEALDAIKAKQAE